MIDYDTGDIRFRYATGSYEADMIHALCDEIDRLRTELAELQAALARVEALCGPNIYSEWVNKSKIRAALRGDTQ